jgi:hypothetical protein
MLLSYQATFVDCGHVASYLANGEIELNDPDNTTIGALATVRCNANYAPEVLTVMCNASGEWENATCYSLGKIIIITI